tara:strand:+ start:140 stop:409 length:270 start_codon:yes stop_codon:yes gene_type:complete
MSTENNTKVKSEWRERELGALWIKQGSSKDYMTGHCSVNNERISVVVFKNNNKSSDRAPDYVIYKHKDREEEASASNNQAKEEVPELLA